MKILIVLLLFTSSLVFAETNPKVSAKAQPKATPKAKADTKANPPVKTGGNNIEYSKIITVHGMVCAFCSNSLEKKFKKEEAIDQVKVDLTSKKVSVLFKKGKSIEDKKLKEIITSSGFKVVTIESTTR